MKLILEDNGRICTTSLPKIISGNYWVLDRDLKNLINIYEEDGSWKISSNAEIKLNTDPIDVKNGKISFLNQDTLELGKKYYLYNISNEKKYILYVLPTYNEFENLIINYKISNSIIIGNSNEADIIVNNLGFSNKQFSINYDVNNDNYMINNLDETNKIYLDNVNVSSSIIKSGDSLFINGIYIYFFGSLLLMSKRDTGIAFNQSKVSLRNIVENPVIDFSTYSDKEIVFFKKEDYFQRPPRFKRQIEKKVFNIDAPTQKQNTEEMPLIFTIAPMLTMGMMSMVTGVMAIQRVASGDSTLKEQFAPILMSFCMLLAMLVFPIMQKSYMKNEKIKKEKKRHVKYSKYIDQKRIEIQKELNFQKTVLLEENLPIENVRDVILNKTRSLWERKLEHNDFLNLRLGMGNRKADIEIKRPEEHFTLEEDDLKNLINTLVKENMDIEDVPITLNFKEHNKVAIIGEKNITRQFLNNLLIQILAYHGYDILRIVILTNPNSLGYFKRFESIPYLFNNDKTVRYFASNKDDINMITSYLMEEYNFRKEASGDNNKKQQFLPYYLVLTDDISTSKNNVFVSEILKSNINYGYSIIMCDEKLNAIPNDCKTFLDISKGMSGIFTSEMTQDNQMSFKADLVDFSIRNVVTEVSNIPLDINNGKFVLPKKYSFLEMFDVGNVEQLNIINRWKNNNIIKSLETPVGIDEQGELFKIDLHEKAHGPHGLVAGMTGSGKSEWIITYILSMAINYSPEEVQFVLIDYKGGGLALTFDNRETGVKLPHVVGTLTNLDIVEMKRSLASINSELKRREHMFKEAREALNESSMDIYKYQELYRAKKLKKPMSHLFIVSDEFAELKLQQPDFMDELISTARIGRSLGVHLILATQKPSGVVDDQIWSNSKFRVCLKVQDKSDSNDMLKCPDAAMLKDTGRFYLQVGYNEFFAKGQCAYAGMPYYESDKKITEIDATVDFVTETGAVLMKNNVPKKNTKYVHKGEELPNVINYIINTAKTQNLKITPLWLSSIPDTIYVDKLKSKYNYEKEEYYLNPILGEYDEPNKQMQNLMTAPISKDGNVLLYGSSGSGKELFITTLIYSLITNHTPDEVALYILDFGSSVLNNFKNASHIGDIIHSGEDEKISNLFKYIKSEIHLRRKKFLQFNGNYQDFIKKSEKKVPNFVVIINGYDVFSELYNNESDKLYELTREGNKMGIYFVITSSSINAVKSKLLQTFKTIYSLQLNNEFDYRSIFGNTEGIVPSKYYGRGLMKAERVLEFQTAYPFNRDELYQKILETSIKTYIKYKVKIRPIPVLPDVVTLNEVNKNGISLSNIPIGMTKKELGSANIKLSDELTYLIGFRDFDENIPFIDRFLHILDKSNITTYVIDSKYIYDTPKFDNLNYFNTSYGSLIDSIYDFTVKVDGILKNNNNNIRSIKEIQDIEWVIVGFDKFMESLDDSSKNKFVEILKMSKDSLKVHIILIDIPSGFKPYEYEPWYKRSIDSSTGLWVGDGFAEQYLIKPTKVIQDYFNIIGNNYGYLVLNGQVNFIKIIEKIN